jgi:tetratricopeptide (TPR) repeat protein
LGQDGKLLRGFPERLKNYKDAVEQLHKFIKHNPKYVAEGYFWLGVSLMKVKRNKPAEEPLRKAVELSPKNKLVNKNFADNRFEINAMVAGEENIERDH